MMGVDYKLFWTLNPKSLTPFVKAFSLKQKYDDSLLWQSGMYIRLAITSSFNKDCDYPAKPFLDTEPAPTKIIETEDEKLKRKFMERMEILNLRFGKEETCDN